MEAPRTLEKNLKKQIKTATEEEKRGLHELWRGLKARHSALSRAETARKRRSHKKRTRNASSKTHTSSHDNSSSNQDQVPCQHKKKTYSDSDREIPLSESAGLVWPATPGEKFNNNPPKLDEIRAVVQKARAKSAPGPNGVPYLLYKICPNILRRLHKILLGAWSNQKIGE